MSRSVFVGVALVFAFNSYAQSDDKAQAVIDRAIEAHGGKTKVAKLSTAQVKVKGTATLPGVGSVPMVIEDSWHLPNRYKSRQEMDAMGMKFLQTVVINGDDVWINVNGQAQTLPKKAQTEIKEQFYAETLDKLSPFLKDRYKLSLLEEVTIDGHAAVGVRVMAADHRDVELYFSKANGLLLKRKDVMIQLTGKKVAREVLFSKYKEVEGVQHWTRIIGYYDGKKTVEAELTEVKFHDKFEDSVFARP